MVDLWVRPWALHGCRPEAEAGHRWSSSWPPLKQILEERSKKQTLATAAEQRRDRRRLPSPLTLALAVPSAVVCATDHKPNTRWSVRTLRCVRRASLRKNILQSWAPGQFHCELTFYDEHYLWINTGTIILDHCDNCCWLMLILWTVAFVRDIVLLVRTTLHILSFLLCVRDIIYYCVRIVMSCHFISVYAISLFLCALTV